MPIIKQKVKGKSVGYLDVTATEADLADLGVLLEGEVTIFDEKASGGSVSPYPLELNRKKFSCGDRDTGVSTSFTVPHCRVTAYKPDFKAVVVGAFDAHPDSVVKCDYMNLLYDRN